MCLTMARPRPVPPSLRLRGVHPVKAFEDAGELILFDAGALIPHFHHHLGVLPRRLHLHSLPGGLYFTALSIRFTRACSKSGALIRARNPRGNSGRR